MERDEKFWSSVDIRGPDDCWLWTRSPSQRYGKYNVKIDGKNKLAISHRYAYEQMYGPIPEGLFVCHSCDEPFCCNPEHLFLGTNQTNQKDAVYKYGFWRENPQECLKYGEEHHSAKLTEKQVKDIRRRYKQGGISQDTLAAKYGISQVAISKVILRKSWKDVDDD